MKIAITRSGEYATVFEKRLSREHVVLIHSCEIQSVIRELQRIYEEIKHDEGEANSMMHDPPIPF